MIIQWLQFSPLGAVYRDAIYCRESCKPRSFAREARSGSTTGLLLSFGTTFVASCACESWQLGRPASNHSSISCSCRRRDLEAAGDDQRAGRTAAVAAPQHRRAGRSDGPPGLCREAARQARWTGRSGRVAARGRGRAPASGPLFRQGVDMLVPMFGSPGSSLRRIPSRPAAMKAARPR